MKILLCSIFFICISGVFSNCDTNPDFEEIPEEDYDRTPHSIQSDGDPRPLGFKRAVVPFNDPEQPNECAKVAGSASGRHIEILFETVPPMKLCMRDNTGRETCAERRHQECIMAESDTMSYEFYCDVGQGCSESDVNFWYRITLGPPAEEDNEGMWCQWRDNEFPEDLWQLPPDIDPPQPTDPPTGTAAGTSCGKILLVAMALLVSLLYKQ